MAGREPQAYLLNNLNLERSWAAIRGSQELLAEAPHPHSYMHTNLIVNLGEHLFLSDLRPAVNTEANAFMT
jgi:hypothetical protein